VADTEQRTIATNVISWWRQSRRRTLPPCEYPHCAPPQCFNCDGRPPFMRTPRV
jgi:hypothetical protein